MNDNKHVINEYITREQFMFKYMNRESDAKLMWDRIEIMRNDSAIEIPIKDMKGNKLHYVHTIETDNNLKSVTGLVGKNITDMLSSDVKDSILLDSLIDEAFGSSVIEGAYSTRRRAREIIKQNIPPDNKSERMILNNYRALVYAIENMDGYFSHEYIYNIWRILIEGTVEDDDVTEIYGDDGVYVKRNNEMVYEEPDWRLGYGMLDNLVEYANRPTGINPIINAFILHYYFVYIHPFFDGNGRTARVLMNIYLLKNGYEFSKYFSISKVLPERREKYYSTIKDCEDGDSDITYFIDFYSNLLLEAVNDIGEKHRVQYSRSVVERLLEENNLFLNDRQMRTIKSSFKNTNKHLDLNDYRKRHKVTYETSRKDMACMVELGIYRRIKTGKKYVYKLESLMDIAEKLNAF
jgi:Fic family protein